MSTHITSGTLGQAMAPLVFAPFVQQFGLRCHAAADDPGADRAALASCFAESRPSTGCRSITKPEGSRALRPVREAADAALPDRRPAHADRHELLDVLPVLLTRRGSRSRRQAPSSSIYLIAVGLGGFIGGPSADRFGPRRVIILSLVCSVPFLMIAPHAQRRRCSSSCSPSADSCCSPRCRSMSRLRRSSPQSARRRCRR